MRKRQLFIFVSLLLMVVAAAAQSSSQLDRVNVVRDTDTIRIEMSSKGVLAPKVSTLDSPARVVVDLPGTAMATQQKHIAVDAAGVKAVRIGMGGQSHPATRVVVDLEKACSYELTPGPEGRLVLSLHAKDAAGAKASDVASSKATSPFASRTVEQSATVETASAKPAQQSPSSPNDYVFVEPSYQAKNDEPAARAQDAAARFSDKTAAELIPVTMHSAQAQNSAPAIQPAVNLAAEQQAQAGKQGVSTGPKYTGEPISVNLKDVDLKDFFRLIHEISGLNVVLDPQVHGTLTIVLDDVPWDQALDIVLANNNLDRQLDGNVLRIARVDTIRKEAEAKRAQLDAVALAVPKVTVTRFLSYAKSDDVVPTLKKFISARGEIIADKRTNSLIIEDIPSTIPRVDELLTKLDRKTPEVEIEARVVAATRSYARDIGVQIGFGWGNSATAVGGTSTVGTSTITAGSSGTPRYILSGTGSAGGGGAIPL